ncbi:unnamed protein product [Ceratitis capitata]|uniref:(Mediterranean fruit fly) hypothetical protein n=1 Tax=Ceratitis capitata TaxID=7213 RepID=A0A811VA33_CERCA|nr:unnamed protein product [Ceratitis capitata]
MASPEEIVIKTEVDFDFIANYNGDGDTQNSQNDAANSVRASCSGSGQQMDYSELAMPADGDCSDDLMLRNWLKQFDLEILYTTLKLSDITYRSLKYLSLEDINTVIRHIGYRAEFREKLLAWRREKSSQQFSAADNNSTVQQANISSNSTSNKRRRTSIVAPAISVQSRQQQSQQLAVASNLQTMQANMASHSGIATHPVMPSSSGSAAAANAITATTTTTGSATIIHRSREPADDFLSLLPGVAATTSLTSNNMPAVVLEPSSVDLCDAFNAFGPQAGESPKRQATTRTIRAATTSTPTLSPTTKTPSMATTTANPVTPRTSITSINDEQQFLEASCSENVDSGSNGGGYEPNGPLIMSSNKVDTLKVLQACHAGQHIRQFIADTATLKIASDLRLILNDIVTIFPNEQAASDYYFIYRGGRGNPLGRLYQRYSNENVKRRRMIRLSDDDNDNNNADVSRNLSNLSSNSNQMDDDDILYANQQSLPGSVPCVDEMTALALKQLLTTDHFTWEEVCERWIQTWALRQKELQQSGLTELLNNWSKLTDPRAAELFKNDFRHVYPNKEHLLVSKWEDYIKKVTSRFDRKLHHDDLKKMYKHVKMGMASKDEKDFIYAVGVITLLPSTSRFKDQYGKLSIRASLTDSIDSFVMRLTSLDSYESRVEFYNRKYGPINRTTHPFWLLLCPMNVPFRKSMWRLRIISIACSLSCKPWICVLRFTIHAI